MNARLGCFPALAVAVLCVTACTSTETCPPGFTECGNSCVALQTDPDHCGSCDNSCEDNALCRDGTCRPLCSAGQTLCGGSCVNTRNDAAHCGACGNACPAGQACVDGACLTACPVGQTLCNGACVITRTDPLHCGACGNACTSGQVCGDGSCSAVCPAGQTSCGGACVNLKADPAHCGACGSACPTGQVCGNGTCSSACPSGQTLCNGACVTTRTDPLHCGACGNACASGQVCGDGSCSAVCPAGQTSCGGTCINLKSDPDHCGTCDNACALNAVCRDGACRALCPAGQTLCGSTCVNTQTDTTNCGTCGNACPSGQACMNGQCSASCGVGQTLCNGACTNTGVDPNNCGACGTVCSAAQRCLQGACQSTCESGLVQALPDPWGYSWDGRERPAATYARAWEVCTGLGGRLPTGSELYRVSAVQSGAVGETYMTNYLWAMNPYSPGSQLVSRLSDGTLNNSDSTTTLHSYRCVCPTGLPISFKGSACNGPPRQECFVHPNTPLGYHMDMTDRPAMPKSSAMWECAFYRAHLADYATYAEAILAGLPNGSGAWLHTADDARYDYDALVRWTNIQTSWPADANTSVSLTTEFRPFRCAGPALPVGTHPNTVANEYVGPLGGNKSERVDSPAAGWAAAHDLCWNRGGHLPRSTELGELVQQGLPAGSGQWLWTSDQEGYNGTQFLAAILRWSGTVPSYSHSYSTYLNWAYKTDPGYPVRCLYYPLRAEYAGPSAADCNGGCTRLALAGTQPAVLWMDSRDRTPATLGSAINLCVSKGGRLASERDYTEAIRHGLPNGTNAWLLTSDIAYGSSGTRVNVIRWNGTDTGFTDQYPTYSSWDALTSVSAYRCMWTNELR